MNDSGRSFTLNQLVMIITVLFLLLTIAGILVTSGYIKQKAIDDLAREDARHTSRLVFQSLYSAMSEGWDKDDIMAIVERLNRVEPDMQIRVLRGEPVIREFGEFPGEKAIREADPLLLAGLAGEESLTRWDDLNIRYIYPVRVEKGCIECHKAASPGDVNGVIDVVYPIKDLKVSLDFIMNMVIGYLTAVMLLLIVALQTSLRSFIVQPVNRLTGVMRNVISHLDLSQRVSSGTRISEIKSLTGYFNKLLATMQGYSRKLEELGTRDGLTGLYNRRKFDEFVEQEVERYYRYDQPFSLLLLDMDNFKHINDTFGHPVGDLVLQRFAKLVAARLRRTDVFARFGGDEFGILLTGTAYEDALEVAETLRGHIAEAEIALPVGQIRTTVSIGLITYPHSVADRQRLAGAMDVAMYKAKRSGKNRVMTLDGGELNASADFFVRGQGIRRALEEGRVDAFLQPIVDLRDGSVFAYEALARIREPDGHLINAAEFIRHAEELGMAEEIDMRVFDRALAAKRHLPNPEARLFFNLSAASFCNQQRMRSLPGRLKQLNVSPREVVFEITEREALPHIGELNALIHELRDHGFAFALDDFGSGFSSFMYLKFLTVDYVKIEGTFVQHMANDARDRIMVEQIHALAEKFGIRTIAEYVEDEPVHHLLGEIGVHYGQGFHYGQPRAATPKDK